MLIGPTAQRHQTIIFTSGEMRGKLKADIKNAFGETLLPLRYLAAFFSFTNSLQVLDWRDVATRVVYLVLSAISLVESSLT
jgi:hypothetical protein